MIGVPDDGYHVGIRLENFVPFYAIELKDDAVCRHISKCSDISQSRGASQVLDRGSEVFGMSRIFPAIGGFLDGEGVAAQWKVQDKAIRIDRMKADDKNGHLILREGEVFA